MFLSGEQSGGGSRCSHEVYKSMDSVGQKDGMVSVVVFWHLFERQACLALLVAALDGQLDFVADVVLGNLGAQVGDALDLCAVDGGDDITLAQACLVGRAAGDDLEEVEPFLRFSW